MGKVSFSIESGQTLTCNLSDEDGDKLVKTLSTRDVEVTLDYGEKVVLPHEFNRNIRHEKTGQG